MLSGGFDIYLTTYDTLMSEEARPSEPLLCLHLSLSVLGGFLHGDVALPYHHHR